MRTVGREAEIDRLVHAIRTAATTDDRPHQLIVGPRGSGKSHLLIVAIREALEDDQTADQVAVAMLPEDAVEIAGYEDLLVSIVDRAPGGVHERRDEARDMRSRHDVTGLERLVLEQVGDRVLILVIENLDRVFRDLGDQGQARLRNLTETSGKLLVLASTPLLFDAVSDHARPWYGSFEVEHLRELDAEQGRELLRRVACAAGDDKLAASLDSPTGLARVKAVEHLAGGSPRMWTVLAGCMTVELLDELVPLVEALFDELAPYYQQRLWELAGVERKLVYELCRVPAATVKVLAHSTGLTERAAATSLGRLNDARWVRREKRAGTDRRTTWYSLREPLLRHHVEYREVGEGGLPAIVSFLRSWFETWELARHLATVSATSLAEAYVLAALSFDEHPARLGAWPIVESPQELVTAARCWITAARCDGLASFVSGVVAEAVGVTVREDARTALDVVALRLAALQQGSADHLTSIVEAAIAGCEGDYEPAEACRRGLLAASEVDVPMADRDRIALGLLGRALEAGSRPSREWLATHASAVDALTDDEERLRLIFQALRAFDEASSDATQALVSATDILISCAARLGQGDLTTRVVAWHGIAMSASSATVVAQRRFAATVVNLITDARLAGELSRVLIFVYAAKRALNPRDDDDKWLAVWADATRESRHLGPIHHFMSPEYREGTLDQAAGPLEDMEPLRLAFETASRVLERTLRAS
ncbi:MAG: hypothetical protein QOJ35_2765 [Solirubrobacteraceae bacterium]|nr:hypothetical protein [Solirubrobacteraceae bacterium]